MLVWLDKFKTIVLEDGKPMELAALYFSFAAGGRQNFQYLTNKSGLFKQKYYFSAYFLKKDRKGHISNCPADENSSGQCPSKKDRFLKFVLF